MSGNAFSRANRLRNSFEFRRVREKGASFKDKTFVMTILKNGAVGHRLGLSIRKSAVRLASRRNKLKRTIRELFRTNKSRFKDGPYDIVFYVRRPLPDNFDYNGARNSLLALMEKAKILC
jgi:ribonuclease P protein component